MCFFSKMAPLLGDTTGSEAFSPVIEHIIVACGGGGGGVVDVICFGSST